MASALTATGAIAQKKAVRGSETNRKAIRLEQAAPKKEAGHKVRTAVMPKGKRATGALNDATVLTSPKTNTPPMKALGDGTKIYGAVIYPYSIVYGNGGIYSLTASTNPNIKKEYAFSSYDADGGGVWMDGKYYYFSYVYAEDYGSYTFVTFLCFDPAKDTKPRILNTRSFLDGLDETQITHDLTYDATTGNVYAISYIIETDDTGLLQYVRPAISTVDMTVGFVTPLAKTPQFIAIAANTAGELYAISKGAESALYRVNKETGECLEIGKTGLNPEYTQSATFDPVTDKLYWTATLINGKSGLYEVDVKTGKADKICDFANDEEFVGIYIPEPTVAAGAPGVVTEPSATFVNASLNGTISFKVPTTNYGGGALTGDLTAIVTVDGAAQAPQSVKAGQTVSMPLTLTEGIHSFTAQISNAAGDGPRAGYSWYVGIDGPAPVGDLKVETRDSKPYISWTAPTTGRNGGYIDPTKLTYTVTRMPDMVTVANNITTTNVTDQTSFEASNVYYTVKAYCDGREGAEATSETGLFGSGNGLPVTYDFNTRDQFELCTVIDANNDAVYEYHWGYWLYSPDYSYTQDLDSPALVYAYSPESAADDWVFMPPFVSEAGKKYRVTFKMWTRGDKETLAVTAGPTATVGDQTVVLAAKEYNHTSPQEFTVEFTAATSGNYYVGFHCTSAMKKWYLFLDDVTIDDVPDNGAPASVENLTVTPGANGAMTATISFTAPRLDGNGKALETISEINIYRGNNTNSIHTFVNPRPGESCTWTDTNPSLGFNTYRIVPSNAHGAGEKALATEYVGYDIPVAVTDLKLTDNGQYPVITWTAPTEGKNGGYVNPDELIYRIIRSDNTILSRNAKGTEFVDKTLPRDPQSFVYYQVEAITEAGIGDYALTEYMIYGNPYSGDFYETFPDASLTTDPWVTEVIKGRQNLWTLYSQGYSPACYDANGDSGLMGFLATYGSNGDEGRLISPKLRIDDMNVPLFSFAFFHSPDYYTLEGEAQYLDRMIPEIRLPDGRFVALDDAIYVDDPTKATSWYLYVYDLSKYKEYGYVQLVFHGIAEYTNDVYIDMVSLEDNSNYDLAAYTFSGPTAVKVGKTGKYRATILNQGVEKAENYNVHLYRNGAKYATLPGTPILSADLATFEFAVDYTLADEGKSYSYNVVIEFDKDEVVSNNNSDYITTKVQSPDVPEPRFVEATLQGTADVKVTWGDADALHVKDSFEDYASFTTSDIGDYTLVDGDKGYTYTFVDIYYDNDVDPKAYIVFNPYTLGLGNYKDDFNPEYDCLPKTGRQMLAAFAAYKLDAYGYASSIDNDDWLITPVVHGGTEVSFWAKAYFDYLSEKEQFEVMYSTTDTNVGSFKRLSSGVITADYVWTEYKYTLPADAKYFAIHHVGNDSFIFFVDDLEFNQVYSLEGATLTGYRVYRNNTVIGDVAADARSFVDTSVADGTYTYAVSAMFGERESAKIPVTVQVGESGVEDNVAGNTIVITTDGHAIVVKGAEGKDVSVTNAAGVVLFSDNAQNEYRVNVQPGVYVVRAGETVRKVAVL